VSRKLDQPQGHGRIWRVVHDTTRRDRAPALGKATPAQLVDTLSHPNGWWRDTAQRLLVERGDRSIAAALKTKAETAPDWRTRLHALWTLDGLDAIEPATVMHALEDASRDVRVSALMLSERWLAQPQHPIHAAVLKRLTDADWAVRHQLAATLGAFPPSAADGDAALMTLLEKYGDDPLTVDAAISGLAGRESAILQKLLATPEATAQRTAAITTLAATVVKSGQDARVQELLQWISAGRPAWQQQALLAGAESALLNAPLPGAPAGRGNPAAAAANANAPGARGGPGGARAFPDQPSEANATGRRGAGAGAGGGGGGGGRGRGAGGPLLALSHQPETLAALAANGGELGTRAANLLARMNWPGKPAPAGAAAPAAPLTPAEQQWYNAGQTVYAALCIACHQEDGRGREKIAPTLVGSQLALAPPAVPIRILLHGKEGAVGLMPPLGGGLTDEQIAGALTYIRRQWGNAGSAVDPATVKEVRAATAARTRPWTNDELLALLSGGRGGVPPRH